MLYTNIKPNQTKESQTQLKLKTSYYLSSWLTPFHTELVLVLVAWHNKNHEDYVLPSHSFTRATKKSWEFVHIRDVHKRSLSLF